MNLNDLLRQYQKDKTSLMQVVERFNQKYPDYPITLLDSVPQELERKPIKTEDMSDKSIIITDDFKIVIAKGIRVKAIAPHHAVFINPILGEFIVYRGPNNEVFIKCDKSYSDFYSKMEKEDNEKVKKGYGIEIKGIEKPLKATGDFLEAIHIDELMRSMQEYGEYPNGLPDLTKMEPSEISEICEYVFHTRTGLGGRHREAYKRFLEEKEGETK